MSDVRKLQELLDKIPYATLMEVKECLWYCDGGNLYWNEGFNSEDLYNQDGDTYSGWMRERGQFHVGWLSGHKSGYEYWNNGYLSVPIGQRS